MNIINNEKGVALVLAMIMLVLMSILGALALSTSTTEIGISGNYKNSQVAFYVADAAIERAQIELAAGTSNASAWNIGSGAGAGTISAGSVSVQSILCSSSPPRGSGAEAGTEQKWSYNLIAATATGPNNSTSNAEALVAKAGGC